MRLLADVVIHSGCKLKWLRIIRQDDHNFGGCRLERTLRSPSETLHLGTYHAGSSGLLLTMAKRGKKLAKLLGDLRFRIEREENV
jgi:hypothetical protein